MKSVLKWALRGVAAIVVIAGVAGLLNGGKIERLMAVNSLFDADVITRNFSHMDRLFFHQTMPRGDGAISPLPAGAPAILPAETDKWLATQHATGMVVLKGGQIVFEGYWEDTTADDRRISWSVAKSFLSALMGIVIADGDIDSLDDPVTKYAPSLIGSAYDGASIRNVLNMASGVEFDEDYLKFFSDINKMGRVLALGASMDTFAARQDTRFVPPGTQWKYVSIDTHVIGMVIRGATGRTIPDLMAEKIIEPLGLEQAPYYVTDGHGVAFVLGGLNLTTRDYARFGQMIAQNGAWQGQQIVPADWIAASTSASAPGGAGYGYQWWIPQNARDGEFMAQGIYGQFLYIDQTDGVVIALNAADRSFRSPGVYDGKIAMFRAIRDAVSQ